MIIQKISQFSYVDLVDVRVAKKGRGDSGTAQEAVCVECVRNELSMTNSELVKDDSYNFLVCMFQKWEWAFR